MDSDQFILTQDQIFLLHVNYLQCQVNDMAIMYAYDMNDIVPKCSYFSHNFKKTWKEFFALIKNFENKQKKYCNSEILANYAEAVEEYVKDDLDEFYFSIRRVIARHDTKQSKENLDLIAKSVLLTALIDYSIARYGHLNNMLKTRKVNALHRQLSLRNIIAGTIQRNKDFNMKRMDMTELSKSLQKFCREIKKATNAIPVDLNSEEICMLTFRKFDDAMSTDDVQIKFFEQALGVRPIDENDEPKRKVEVGKPFRIGRGKFIGRLHDDLQNIKCNQCVLHGKPSCSLIDCCNCYIERL